VTEYNAVSGEPVNLTLGYKRRIAAVVPPQAPAGAQNPLHKGESLSLVSTFEVEPGGTAGVGEGLVIRNVFASGGAAIELTKNSDAEDKVKALFLATSIPDLSDEDRRRRDALLGRLRNMTNEEAAQVLKDARLAPVPPRRCTKNKATESRCTLKDLLSRADDALIATLEPAFKKLR
jgi:hypothetical protein